MMEFMSGIIPWVEMVTIKAVLKVIGPDVGTYFHSEEPKGSGQSNIPRAGELGGFSYWSGPMAPLLLSGKLYLKWEQNKELIMANQ